MGEPARLKRKERDRADYAQWLARESASLPTVEQARATSNSWTHKA
jgi:hypothetical protein